MTSLELGAVQKPDGVAFCLWAPGPGNLALVLRDRGGERTARPVRGKDGYWRHFEPGAGEGLRYGYLVDGAGPFPDPCSRSQPEGVHALSEVVAPGPLAEWEPPAFEDLVLYELHVGTFTDAGSFTSVAGELGRLARLGINAIEIMPVASFAGRWNWGYDGVALWAPFHGYGGPEGLREFIRSAHEHGIAVILDVVYNHFGPDGNYTGQYSRLYYRSDRHTPWGDAINFDSQGSREVRRFFIENAVHWLTEYGIDGLRLDATHAIIDESEQHFLAELSTAVREAAGRRVYLIAETHENDARYVRPVSDGGFGFDAVWADDFHHAARTSVAGDREAYFAGFDGLPSLRLAVEEGWLYQGQVDPGYGAPRGGPAAFGSWGNLVYCLQNHDQVGNRAFGERLTRTADEGAIRALTTLLLLHPATPMLFQGEEFGSARPFLYFTDHSAALANAIRDGRRAEFARFAAFADAELRERIPDPQDERSFRWSKLEPPETRDARSQLVEDFHRALIQLRASDSVLRRYRREWLPLRASISGDSLSVRFEAENEERLLVMNLSGGGTEVDLPGARGWQCLFNSDEAAFGGYGAEVCVAQSTITIPPRSAAFLAR